MVSGFPGDQDAGAGSVVMDQSALTIAIVIPAYRAAGSIEAVIAKVPEGIAHIVVVDDASPDELQAVVARIRDPRLVVLRHEQNGGVGAAMKTGFAKALELGADIVLKIDADGQMDPDLIPEFVEPILSGEADVTKGNRFAYLRLIRRMPFARRLGNLGLSFLAKAASGYWHAFDPTNGYVAVRSTVLEEMDRDRLSDRFFFEISFLCEAYFTRALLVDVPMPPVYEQELSSLKPMMMIGHFTPRLVGRFFHRIFMSYFLRDFNAVSIFLTAGVPTFLFGFVWTLYHWIHSYGEDVHTGIGTVMVGALGILIGFQLILQATVLDVENEPGRGGREPHRPRRKSLPG